LYPRARDRARARDPRTANRSFPRVVLSGRNRWHYRSGQIAGRNSTPLREPEPETVARARAGDLEAFEELVRTHQADVYRLAIQLVRDPPTAEDVAQEAFLRAYRSFRRFRGQAKFSTWLFRITRNCAVDAIRRRERLRRMDREALADEEFRPDLSLRASLERAIEGLPPDLREPFVLIEVLGLSYTEASTVLSVVPGTLKSRMHRARRLLMTALEEVDTGEA
jgi:RNA polymerase sigma-70 factor (ECF subfamily)